MSCYYTTDSATFFLERRSVIKKYIGYIPAVLFTAMYLFAGLTGASLELSMILIWLTCFWISAFLLHKGFFWGGIFGIFPTLHMIYMGTTYTGQVTLKTSRNKWKPFQAICIRVLSKFVSN